MLQQSVRIVFLISTLGLYSIPQISLASELKPVGHTSSKNKAITVPRDYYIDDLLPQSPHLTISLSRRQVTLYRGKTAIKSYRIAVGRSGWETPIGNYKVLEMLVKPTWINPLTGQSIPGGDPENPLGKYWIGFWTDGRDWIGFHGTPNPESVGQAVSHGCIRMYNKDVEELFSQLTFGTVVNVEP